MVDRGGLNYKISIKDDFTKQAKRFRREIGKSRRAWTKFKRSQSGTRKASQDMKKLADETERVAKATSTAGGGARNERKLLVARRRLVRINNTLIAQEAKLRSLRSRGTQLQQQATQGQVRAQRAANDQLKKTEGGYSRLFQTFRRIIGAYAAFAAFRFTRDQFAGLVGAGLQFTDTVNESRLGIAGLIQTLGEVRTAQGDLVEGQERFAAATGLAQDQIFKLRQDSLKTVATFEQLLDTFQVAVGPGLAQGLDLDEVRTLAVQISQAASALSVPQNQLAEEIRSLLSGTIQARTTRIATALGITNENIRNWRQGGQLFIELTKRLEGFSEAAEKAARETLGGLRAINTGALQEVLGVASQPLYDELIETLNFTFDKVLTIRDEFGNIRPNPELVASLQSLFITLSDITSSFRALGEQRIFGGLEAGAEGIATSFDEIKDALGGSVSLFREFRQLADDANEATDGLSGNILAAGTQLTVLSAVFGKTFGLLATALVTLDSLLEKATGLQLTLTETAGVARLVLSKAFLTVGGVINEYLVFPVEKAVLGYRKVFSVLRIESLKARAFLATLFGDDEQAIDLEQRAIQAQLAADNEFRAAKKDMLRRQDLEREIQERLLNEQDKGFDKLAANADKRRQERADKEFIASTPEAQASGQGFFVDPRQVADPKLDLRIEKLQLEQRALVEQSRAAKILVQLEEQRLGTRRRAEATAIAEARLADAKLQSARQEAAIELQRIRNTALTSTGDRKLQQEQLFEATARRKQAELEILYAQQQQTAELLRQQQLIATGTFSDGFGMGAKEWAESVNTNFQAGLEVAKQTLDGFTNLVSTSIVDAFDPTKEVDLNERFARFMQQIAQTVINELIRIQIAKQITGTQSLFPGVSRASGGIIPHAGPQARGYARGGSILDVRPAHIPRSDTVPTWLTPGEFVMSKAAVDSIGVGTLTAMNNGNFGVTGSASAAGAQTGMASGGSVKAQVGSSGQVSSAPTTTVVPAVVASESNMDKLNAGGRNAMLAFLKENSDIVRSYLQ